VRSLTGVPRLNLPTSRAGQAVAVLVVVACAALIGVGTALGGPAVLGALSVSANPVRTSPPPSPAVPTLTLHPLGADAPAPTAPGLAAALDHLVASPALGQLTGLVVDPLSGGALWSRDPAQRRVPGSTAKLVTAAAALLAIDPEKRLETTVVAGAEPGTVVLVGGGDPTLTSLPAGHESVYPGAPHLDDLVTQVKAAAPSVKKVLVDVGRYTGDALAPGWSSVDIAGGFIAPIVPVMLDGGRGVPTGQNAARTGTPALAAATELAKRLGADPVGVGTAPPGAAVLGTVRSQPVRELVIQALRASDNVLAEVLAHEVAIATGKPASFAGAAQAMHDVLAANGIDPAELHLVDGSGLSTQDQVSARGLAAVLAAAAGPPAGDRTAKLRPLVEGLPVAGGSGTLVDRYDGGTTTGGRGYVRAKTGTLDGVNSLAGLVLDADGRLLVFALLSAGSTSASARPALDAIATTLRSCGCR
jgi:serine-type D-Ala-D-Ala carboxypeptidase/endopeptidase (penicillin-binding protein 4)